MRNKRGDSDLPWQIAVPLLIVCLIIWWADFNNNEHKRIACETYAKAHGGHVEGYSAGSAYWTKRSGEQFTDAGFKVVMPDGHVVYDQELLK